MSMLNENSNINDQNNQLSKGHCLTDVGSSFFWPASLLTLKTAPPTVNYSSGFLGFGTPRDFGTPWPPPPPNSSMRQKTLLLCMSSLKAKIQLELSPYVHDVYDDDTEVCIDLILNQGPQIKYPRVFNAVFRIRIILMRIRIRESASGMMDPDPGNKFQFFSS